VLTVSEGVLTVSAGGVAAAVGVTTVSAGGVAAAGVTAVSAGVVTVAVGAAVAAAGVMVVSVTVLVVAAGAVAAAGGVLAVCEGVLTVAVGAAAAAAAQCSEIMFSSVTAMLLSAAAELAPLALCPIRVTSWPTCGLRSTLLVVILKMRPVLSCTTV